MGILKNLLFLLIALKLLIAQHSDSLKSNNIYNAQDSTKTYKINDELPIDTFTINAVGDIMLGTHYPSKAYLPPNGDCSMLLKDVEAFLKDADLTFGNCEGTFCDEPHKYVKPCKSLKYCYRFAMPEKFINCFVNAGFDVLSIANNHIHDLQEYGKKNTIKVIKSAGLHCAGVCILPEDTFTINGVKIGFCAFAPNYGTCRITDIQAMQQRVKRLDSICDIVIVSFHGGAEGAKYEHVPKKAEIFLGENRGNVYEFAHKAIDAGADVVLGHGPHVCRALELYKDRIIAYSLGNFCTYKRFNISGPNGIAPILKIYVTKNGEFIKGKIIPTYQDENKGTLYDPQKRIIKKLQYLTKMDFPDTPLEITDKGDILKK